MHFTDDDMILIIYNKADHLKGTWMNSSFVVSQSNSFKLE